MTSTRSGIIALTAAAIFAAVFSSTAFSEVRVVEDLFITKAGETEIRGDMYIPDGKGPFPGMLFIHGGGFVGGSRKWSNLPPLNRAVAEKGYVVFSVDYRLLKEGGIFPNNVKDCKCGLAWMKEHAAEYGIDAERIGVMGESAGGYMSAMIAMTQNLPEFQPDCDGREKADTSVRMGVLHYGPTNFVTFKNSFSDLLELEIKRLARLKSKKEIEQYKKAHSPVNYAMNAPPLFLAFSNPDRTVPPSQQHELIEALKREGRVFDFLEVTGPDMDHGFIVMRPDSPQTAEAMERMFAFMEKYLKN